MEVRTLKEWRTLRALSIRDLAAKAGVSSGTVMTAESGERTPTLRSWRRISEALEIEPSQILEFRAAMGLP